MVRKVTAVAFVHRRPVLLGYTDEVVQSGEHRESERRLVLPAWSLPLLELDLTV